MKGVFIPGITAEMFKNGCLESIEELMAEGEVYDIDYPQEPKTGHWESWTKGRVMCSVCKREPFNGKGAEGLKYCPHCGCRMMESEG